MLGSLRSVRRTIALAMCLTAISSILAATAAEGHGNGAPTLTLTPVDVAAGDVVRVAGDDFTPAAAISLVLVGAGARGDLGTVTVHPEGHFTVDARVPDTTAPGPYLVEADGDAGPLATTPLTIGARPSGDPQPDDGALVTIGVIVVAVVLGVSGGIVLARRSRARTG